MIVVDPNVIAARTLTSVLTSKAEKVEKKDPVWVVPVLWRYEFQYILATAIKARQLTQEHVLGVWQRVSAILVENESEPSPAKVIDLVAQYGITAYDGQFIALAMEMGIPCITEGATDCFYGDHRGDTCGFNHGDAGGRITPGKSSRRHWIILYSLLWCLCRHARSCGLGFGLYKKYRFPSFFRRRTFVCCHHPSNLVSFDSNASPGKGEIEKDLQIPFSKHLFSIAKG